MEETMTAFKKKSAWLFAAAVAVTFLLSFLSVKTPVARADGEDMPSYNSVDDVYEISTPEQLQKLAELVNGAAKTPGGEYYSALSYKLTANIDLDGKSWTPIGTGAENDFWVAVDITNVLRSIYENDVSDDKTEFNSQWAQFFASAYTDDTCQTPATSVFEPTSTNYYYGYRARNAFYGTFDGNGKIVSNLTYSSDLSTYAGLFGYVKNASINNVSMTGANVSLTASEVNYVGGIAGFAENSVIDGCGVVSSEFSGYAYVGGVVGKIMSTDEKYSNIRQSIDGVIASGVETALNAPKKVLTVASCYSIASELSSHGYTGGILGFADGSAGSVTLQYCFNGSDILSAGSHQETIFGETVTASQGAGVIGGATNSSAVNVKNSLGIKTAYHNENILFGALVPVSTSISVTDSYYLIDGENDGRDQLFTAPDRGATYCDLLGIVSSSVRSVLGVSYWRQGGAIENSTYAYPVPSSCPASVSVTFTGHTVTENGVIDQLHFVGFSYVYPSSDALTKAGYTLLGWTGNGASHSFGDSETITQDLVVEPVWQLNAPTLTVDSYSIVYSGIEKVIAPTLRHDASDLTVTYSWKKDDGEWFTASSVTVKNVADSGNYVCHVVVTDQESLQSSAETSFAVSISQKSLVFRVLLSLDSAQNNAMKRHVYDGAPVAQPTYSVTGLNSSVGHTLSPEYLYSDGANVLTRSQTADVGSYTISANVTVSDEFSSDCSANYDVSYVPYEYVVTPATIVYTCSKSSPFSVSYTGNAVQLDNGDFSVTTVNDQVYTITTNGSYTDVVENGILYYSISAPNHTTVEGSVVINILPVTLVPSKAIFYNNIRLSKTYDGTTDFPSSSVNIAWFDLNVPTSYPGTSPQPTLYCTRAYFSQRNAGTGLTLTVELAVQDNNGNFVLQPNSIVYGDCAIDKKQVLIAKTTSNVVFSKTYDKTTNALNVESALIGKYSTTDNVTVLPQTATYNSSHVSEADVVTVTFVLATAYKTNYRFYDEDEFHNVTEKESYTVDFGGQIAPAAVTITQDLSVPIVKTYDKTNSWATSNVLPEMYIVTTPNDDVVTPLVTSVQFSTRYVGDAIARINFSLDQEITDYALSTSSEAMDFVASVSPLAVSVSEGSVVAENRVYDGTTDVILTGGSLVGVLSGDTVTITLHGGSISSPNASETPYAVTVAPITIDNENYILSVPSPSGVTVIVSKATSVVRPTVTGVAYVEDDILPELTLSDGDTPGTVSWDEYELIEAGDLSFSWTFLPEDAVNYTSATGTLVVTVVHKVVTQIRLSVRPTKMVYTALQSFDPSGMEIVGDQNSGSTEVIPQKRSGYDGYTILYPTEESVLHYGDSYVTVEYNGLTLQVEITVNKIQRALPFVSGLVWTYNGYRQRPYVEGVDETVQMTGDDSATDKGDYLLTIALTDTNEYVWADGTSEPLSYPWRILPVGRHLLSLSALSFVYSGEINSVLLRNDDNTDKDFYSVDAASVFSATDAGTYSITASLCNDNYYWIDPNDPEKTDDTEDKTFLWTIYPKKVVKPVLYRRPFVFDGSQQAVVMDESDEYVSTGDLTYTDAGDYVIRVTLNNVYDDTTLVRANYVWTDDETADVYVINYNVQKMSIDVPKPAITSAVYNGALYSTKMQSTNYYAVTGKLQAATVGTYNVYVALIDKNNTIWKDGTSDEKNYTWHITPVYVDRPNAISDNVYTGYEQTANISLNDFNSYYNLFGNSAKNVGTYTARASLKDRVNYRWDNGSAEDIDIQWKIVRAVVSIPEAPKNLLYNGFTQTAYIEPNDAYTITGNTGKDKGTYTATVTLRDTDGYAWNDESTEPKTFEWGIYGITVVSDGQTSSISSNYELSQNLDAPSKTGFLFGGWYTSPDFDEGSKITSVDEIDADMTLYAKWTKVSEPSGEKTVEPKPSEPEGTGLSKSTKDKLMAGGIIFGACLLAALLILILGKRRR